jgi:hypothetical protein
MPGNPDLGLPCISLQAKLDLEVFYCSKGVWKGDLLSSPSSQRRRRRRKAKEKGTAIV